MGSMLPGSMDNGGPGVPVGGTAQPPERDQFTSHTVDGAPTGVRYTPDHAQGILAGASEPTDEENAWITLVRAAVQWTRYMDQWDKFRFDTEFGPVYVNITMETEHPESFDHVLSQGIATAVRKESLHTDRRDAAITRILNILRLLTSDNAVRTDMVIEAQRDFDADASEEGKSQ